MPIYRINTEVQLASLKPVEIRIFLLVAFFPLAFPDYSLFCKLFPEFYWIFTGFFINIWIPNPGDFFHFLRRPIHIAFFCYVANHLLRTLLFEFSCYKIFFVLYSLIVMPSRVANIIYITLFNFKFF